MLGAQALRTKQKAERKEKEKRHRERLRSIEIQRNQMQRAACEDAQAAAQFMEVSANPPIKVRSLSLCKYGDETLIVTTKHRHSVHSGNVPHLQVRMSSHRSNNGSADRFEIEPRGSISCSHDSQGPQRSTSSDYCRVEKKHSISSTTRLLKWLGISDSDRKSPIPDEMRSKPLSKRRMSTFT